MLLWTLFYVGSLISGNTYQLRPSFPKKKYIYIYRLVYIDIASYRWELRSSVKRILLAFNQHYRHTCSALSVTFYEGLPSILSGASSLDAQQTMPSFACAVFTSQTVSNSLTSSFRLLLRVPLSFNPVGATGRVSTTPPLNSIKGVSPPSS